ncbi:MAG: Holliday junction branch migration protein RuvA [Opitutaceae bacterium]|nr:Holliday junction branch migration protein RuvA [Opitutaceae bacterium]
MITSIHGTLVAVSPLVVVVEANGLGYEVNIPVTTAEKLPAPGAVVKLHTLAVYREDSQALYGFTSSEERDFFRLMIEKVTGVGPKVALSIMSRLSLPMLQGAITAGDVGMLAKCPGIGKKTAERLIVELRSHFTGAAGLPAASASSSDRAVAHFQHDAVKALVALGYKTADADKVVRQAWIALGPSASTEELIKRALG